jgi:hypothetical protein
MIQNKKSAHNLESKLGEMSDTSQTSALSHQNEMINPGYAIPNKVWRLTLTLLSVSGLVLVAMADAAARQNSAWAESLFWLGLLSFFAPIAGWLLSSKATSRERFVLIMLLGLGLYVVKVMHSPLTFIIHDEFLHWRTANDILTSGHLFGKNPLLPISAVYPGMEIVAVALTQLSGLSLHTAVIVLLGIVRLLFVLTLYLLFKRIGGSERIGALASLLYMTNSNFVFFNGQFAYETLALPLATLMLLLAVRRSDANRADRISYTISYLLILGAVIATHHLTSYAFAGFLLLWTAIDSNRRLNLDLDSALVELVRWYAGESTNRQLLDKISEQVSKVRKNWRQSLDTPTHASPVMLALIALVASWAWSTFVADSIVVDYVSPHFRAATNELARVIGNETGAGRQLFQSSSGQIAPLWERATGVAAAVLTLLGMPWGLLVIWRRHRENALALMLTGISLGYVLSLALRLTSSGWETGNRLSEFVFLGVGFVLAIGITEHWLSETKSWRPVFPLVIFISIIFLGGVIAGFPPSWRLPGPYIANALTRSIERQGVSAAEWARVFLGPDNRIGGDRTNELLMGSYGEQHIVNSLNDGVDVEWILYAPTIEGNEIDSIQLIRLRYLIVDNRLRGLPQLATNYYPDATTGEALDKFASMPNVSRVFDSGDILIYDLKEILNAP